MAADKKILVVDDDEVTRIYLENTLHGLGFEASTAENFEAVKTQIKDTRYALVLLDLVFTDYSYSGFDMLEYIHSVCPGCAVVIMTSYPSTHTAVQALRMKASDYLMKPVKQNELLQTIENVLIESDSESDSTTETVADEAATDEPEVTEYPFSLSSKEVDVLQLLYKGYSYTEIAKVMECGVSTAKTYGKRAYKKLGVQSRSEAVYEALQYKLIK